MNVRTTKQIEKMIELHGMNVATNYQNAKNLLANKMYICFCDFFFFLVWHKTVSYIQFEFIIIFGIGSIASWSMSHAKIATNYYILFLTRNSKFASFGRQMPKTFAHKELFNSFHFRYSFGSDLYLKR